MVLARAVVRILVALVAAWLGVLQPVAAIAVPTVPNAVCTYDGVGVSAALTDNCTERGPPVAGYAYNDTATPGALDRRLSVPSERPHAPGARARSVNDGHPALVQVARSAAAREGASPVGNAAPITYGRTGVAANTAPKLGTLSDVEARAWYHAQLDVIPGRIDASLPLRDRALQAFTFRNEIKMQARDLMADRPGAAALPPPRTLSEVVGRAYESGARGDDVWRYVLRGSGTSNPEVDRLLGLR